jgi:hypothetical protein
MFAIGTEEEYYGGGEGSEPSDYELHVAQVARDRELKRQVRKFGKEAMQSDPQLTFGDSGGDIPMEEVQKSYIMRMPGQSVPKKEVKDPLKSLMKQMGLTMGPDIMQVVKDGDDASAKVVKLPPHDDRAATPLQNPMKKHAIPPQEHDHGLCLTTGFAAAYIGGVSSGKSTCLASCCGRNHARFRYDNIWLMHPDAEAAKSGEYGLMDDIKILTHWPKIEEWESMSPGRTALICDDISWQLSKRGDPNQYTLAERCLGYMRSHKKGSMDVYIGQQQIYGIPPQIRKLISTWFIFPRRTSPTTHSALAAACMVDRATLRKMLDFVEGDHGFLLINNLADGRPRARVNGWRAIRGLL